MPSYTLSRMLVSALLALAPAFYLRGAPREFTDPVNLSNTTGASGGHKIAVEGENVYVLWEDATFGSGDILFRKSTDGGLNFEPAVNISRDAGPSVTAQFAVSGRNVYVTWSDRSAGDGEIFFSKCQDGKNFSAPVNISQSALDSRDPKIAVDGPNIYVTWTDINWPATTNDLVFARSNDGGQHFQQPVYLSHSRRIAPDQIAVHNGTIYIVSLTYFDHWNCVLIMRSIDGGANFQDTSELGSCDFALFNGPARMAFEANRVYVAWRGDMPVNVSFNRSLDAGKTYGTPKQLAIGTAAYPHNPAIAATQERVYLAWTGLGLTSREREIYVSRSQNSGASFEAFQKISSTGLSVDPGIVARQDHVYVAWNDQFSGKRILFSQSADAGDSFQEEPSVVSADATASESPQMAVNANGSVYVLWRDLTPGNGDIFLAASIVQPPLRVHASPETVWRAHHKFVQVNVEVNISEEIDPSSIRLESITCQRKCHPGGITGADFGADDRQFTLRVKPGQVFTIVYSATDFSGTAFTAETTVRVEKE